MERLIYARWLEERLLKAMELVSIAGEGADLNNDEELNKLCKHKHGAYADALTFVRNAPTIETAPAVYAKWIKITSRASFDFCCSECGKMSEFNTHFCPHCGANMRKKA